MEERTKKLIAYLMLPTIVAVCFAIIINIRFVPKHELTVSFYDVGQGDATFIQTYEGNQILIDGGPGDSVLHQLSKSMPFFDRTIELVIVSHPHEDHISGLIEVLRRYQVKRVLLPDVEFTSAPFQELLRLIVSKNIETSYGFEGQRIHLDSSTVFDIYYPPPGHFIADNDYEGLEGNKRNPNDVSIVGKLIFGKTKILFTGDAGKDIEEIILPKYNLDADILKVGHQGSRHSTSHELVQEVTPAYSVIMVGNNSYGHPTQEAIDIIKKTGSKIFRTDLDGTVNFESDGTTLNIK